MSPEIEIEIPTSESEETKVEQTVDEKLSSMESRLNDTMTKQMNQMQTMIKSLFEASVSTEMISTPKAKENETSEDAFIHETSVDPIDGDILSLSNKSSRELKKKFDLIMKEIDIELKSIVSDMKEEHGLSAVKFGLECLKSKVDRGGRLIDKYSGFDDDEEELNEMIQRWLDLQTDVLNVKTRAEDYLDKVRKTEDAEKRVKENVRLPRLQVKEFKGDPLEWPNWYASFKRCVHDNKELNQSAKHDYLMSVVRGKAEQAIKGYFDDPQKYEKALEVLKKRFGNERLVSREYLAYFLETYEPAEENSDALRKHYDRQLNATGTLKMYKVDDEALKLAICEKTLSPKMTREWEKKHEEIVKSKGTVTLEDYFEFYDKVITSWEATKTVAILDKVGMKKDEKKRGKNDKKPRYVDTRISSIQTMVAHADARQPCIFCDKRNHASGKCRSAFAKDVDERWKLVSAVKCCFNCLLPMGDGHNSMTCTAPPCGEDGCQLKHARILHSKHRKTRTENRQESTPATYTSSVGLVRAESSPTGKQKLCPMAVGTLID